MPDITIIRTHFPDCITWRDVVIWIKRNLNLRTITINHFWSSPDDYNNAVWFSEIVTLFTRCGLSKEDSHNLVRDLVKMGFLEVLHEIDHPQNWVIGFLV